MDILPPEDVICKARYGIVLHATFTRTGRNENLTDSIKFDIVNSISEKYGSRSYLDAADHGPERRFRLGSPL